MRPAEFGGRLDVGVKQKWVTHGLFIKMEKLEEGQALKEKIFSVASAFSLEPSSHLRFLVQTYLPL